MTMTGTKVSTKTKVAIGIALAAGAILAANLISRFSSPTDTTLTKTTTDKTTDWTTTTTTTTAEPVPVVKPAVVTEWPASRTGLDYGPIGIAQFRINVAPTHALSLRALAFRVDVNLPTGFTLGYPSVAVSGPGIAGTSIAGTFVNDGSCGFAVSATQRCLRVPFSGEQVIPAGSLRYYTVNMQVTSPTGKTGLKSGNSIGITLLGDPSQVRGALSGSGTSLGIGGATQNFIWSDMSASPHSLSSGDWWNGAYAAGLPNGPQVLSRQ